MQYKHRINQKKSSLPVGKVVCVGRNYAAHAKELNNPVPDEPVLFLKPQLPLWICVSLLLYPSRWVAVIMKLNWQFLIGQRLSRGCTEKQVQLAITGVGLALDLTLRDLQQQLKSSGLPWEKAKAFDGACPLSEFISSDKIENLQDLNMKLWQNGELRQDGHTAQMLTPVLSLIIYATQFFTLEPGDIILTGTPSGVGALQSGDQLRLALSDYLTATTTVD